MSGKDWSNSCSASLEPGERKRDIFSAECVYLEKASILDINLRVFLETLTYRCDIFLLVVLKDPAFQEYAKSLLIFNLAIISEVSETLPHCYCRTYIALGSSKEIKHGLETVDVGMLCETEATVGKLRESRRWAWGFLSDIPRSLEMLFKTYGIG